MEGALLFDDSDMTNLLLKNEKIPFTSEVLDSLWVPNPSPSFHGSTSMVNFEAEDIPELPFATKHDTKIENCSDDFDGSFYQPEKKRRLFPDQVRFLEKSFEVENKLEPERKIRLAKQLGLQPRQVTIWFQNRRARYRTKQLEKEYYCLKGSFDKLKQDCNTLSRDNEKLKTEVQFLTDKLLGRENWKPKTEPCPILDVQPKNPISASNVVPLVSCKQEGAASSAKSDVLDSDSPHYNTDVALFDFAYSEQVGSDFSQDENDSLRKSLLPHPSFIPKLEVDDECHDDLQPNSCNFGFPVQDQGTWFWQY